jgi:hypothetical protein
VCIIRNQLHIAKRGLLLAGSHARFASQVAEQSSDESSEDDNQLVHTMPPVQPAYTRNQLVQHDSSACCIVSDTTDPLTPSGSTAFFLSFISTPSGFNPSFILHPRNVRQFCPLSLICVFVGFIVIPCHCFLGRCRTQPHLMRRSRRLLVLGLQPISLHFSSGYCFCSLCNFLGVSCCLPGAGGSERSEMTWV